MNILKYRRRFVYQDSWGTGGAEGTAGAMSNYSNNGGENTGTRSIDGSTNPDQTPNWETGPSDYAKIAAQKDADMSPTAAAESGQFTPDQTKAAQTDPGWFVGGTAYNYTPESQPLSDMFNPYAGFKSKDFSGYTTGSALNVQNSDQVQSAREAASSLDSPGFWATLGVKPGMTTEQFFNQETPSQKEARMGMVNNTLGALGNAAIAVTMPPAFRVGLGAVNAYNGYESGQLTGQQAIGKTLASLGGNAGIVGNALTGNYGGAIAGALRASGADAGTATLASLGTNAVMGKDVTSQAIGLGSYYAGVKMGGPVGGLFAQQLGKDLASVFRKK